MREVIKMKPYDKLKKIRKSAKKANNLKNNLSDTEREEIRADILKEKADMQFELECVESSVGKAYTVLIEYYYFKGLTDDEISIEKSNGNTDLLILPDELKRMRDTLRTLFD